LRKISLKKKLCYLDLTVCCDLRIGEGEGRVGDHCAHFLIPLF
jgi:hypothetical protein